MAEVTVLTPVLMKLGPIIEKMVKKELSLHLNAATDAKKLEQRLKLIQEVLHDAEKRGATNQDVKSWLETLQSIPYEIDDVLDEWEHERLKQHYEDMELNAASNQSSSSPDHLREKVISILQTVGSCFNHFCDRRGIAVTVRKLNERLDSLAEENKKKFNFLPNQPRAPYEFKRPDSTSLVDEDKIKGREADMRALVDKLVKESGSSSSSSSSSGPGNHSGPQVISIVGFGGMGKTTLAQLVFRRNEVQTHFPDMKTWVCVSHPFDQTKIAKEIMGDLFLPVSPTDSLQRMLKTIETSIEGKKILLVLDDVWLTEREIWEPLQTSLKKCEPGSKILVTTRNTKVAEIMGSAKSDVCNLEGLSDEHCWSIIRQIALRGKSEADRRVLEEIGRGIAKKCKGLPLAARFMGGVLCSSSDKVDLDSWKRVLESEVRDLKGAREELFSILRLSYNELAPVARRCFSYCAIFPKDSVMNVEKLTRIWMAQGFIPGSDAREVESNAQEYFNDLAARSFFQDFEKDDNRITWCKMHDTVHDFAQQLTGDECLIMVESNDTAKGPKMVSEDRWQNARHAYLDLKSPISVFHTENLHSFFLAENATPLRILFNQLKRVRVLSLKRCGIEEVPEEIGNLIHLRFLDLSWNTFQELPETICELFELQTLDLSECSSISQIHGRMEKLHNLRHLLNEGSRELKFPQGLEKLTNLRTLSRFETSETTRLSYLKDLNQLRSLEIHVSYLYVAYEVEDAENADLNSKELLENLLLNFFDRGGRRRSWVSMDVVEALKPPPNLRILYIANTYVPNWMSTLTNLRDLHLRLGSCESPPELYPLAMLPVLEKLVLHHMHQMTCFGHDFFNRPRVLSASVHEAQSGNTIFPQLKELVFTRCSYWIEWKDIDEEEGNNGAINVSIFPCLERLRISRCRNLEALPHRLLEKISSLKDLEISRNEHLQSRYNQSNGEDWPKISHIPRVYFHS